MPVFEITYPQGALEPDARAKLVDEMTNTILRAEKAPINDFFRSITWGHLHELPADSVIAGGRPVDKPTFRLDLTTPEGALSDRRRELFTAEATKLILEAAGLPEEDAIRVFVLMHEVAEGSWGAAGQVVRFEELRGIAKKQMEKADGAQAETAEPAPA
jgi:phenylpyruvate tautomerase PptA (4-oxalocrotonate tautomerase family)